MAVVAAPSPISLRHLVADFLRATDRSRPHTDARAAHQLLETVREKGPEYVARFLAAAAAKLHRPSSQEPRSALLAHIERTFASVPGDNPYLLSLRVSLGATPPPSAREQGVALLREKGVKEKYIQAFLANPHVRLGRNLSVEKILRRIVFLHQAGVRNVEHGFIPLEKNERFLSKYQIEIISLWCEYEEAFWRVQQNESLIHLDKKFSVNWVVLPETARLFIEQYLAPDLPPELALNYSLQNNTYVDLSVGNKQDTHIVEVKTSRGDPDPSEMAKTALQAFRHALVVQQNGLKGVEYVFYGAKISSKLLETLQTILKDIMGVPFRIWQTCGGHRHLKDEYSWPIARSETSGTMNIISRTDPTDPAEEKVYREQTRKLMAIPVSPAFLESFPECHGNALTFLTFLDQLPEIDAAFFCEEGRSLLTLLAFLERDSDPSSKTLAEEIRLTIEAFVPGDSVAEIAKMATSHYAEIRRVSPKVAYFPELESESLPIFLSRKDLPPKTIAVFQALWKKSQKFEDPEAAYTHELEVFYQEQRRTLLLTPSLPESRVVFSEEVGLMLDAFEHDLEPRETMAKYARSEATHAFWAQKETAPLVKFHTFLSKIFPSPCPGTIGATIFKDIDDLFTQAAFLADRGADLAALACWTHRRLTELASKYHPKIVDHTLRVLDTVQAEKIIQGLPEILSQDLAPIPQETSPEIAALWKRFETTARVLKKVWGSWARDEFENIMKETEVPSSDELHLDFLDSISREILKRYLELRLKRTKDINQPHKNPSKRPSLVDLSSFYELTPEVAEHFLQESQPAEEFSDSDDAYTRMKKWIFQKLSDLEKVYRIHGYALKKPFQDARRISAHWLFLSPEEDWTESVLFYFAQSILHIHSQHAPHLWLDFSKFLDRFPELKAVPEEQLSVCRQFYEISGRKPHSDITLRMICVLNGLCRQDKAVMDEYKALAKSSTHQSFEQKIVLFYLKHRKQISGLHQNLKPSPEF